MNDYFEFNSIRMKAELEQQRLSCRRGWPIKLLLLWLRERSEAHVASIQTTNCSNRPSLVACPASRSLVRSFVRSKADRPEGKLADFLAGLLTSRSAVAVVVLMLQRALRRQLVSSRGDARRPGEASRPARGSSILGCRRRRRCCCCCNYYYCNACWLAGRAALACRFIIGLLHPCSRLLVATLRSIGGGGERDRDRKEQPRRRFLRSQRRQASKEEEEAARSMLVVAGGGGGLRRNKLPILIQRGGWNCNILPASLSHALLMLLPQPLLLLLLLLLLRLLRFLMQTLSPCC